MDEKSATPKRALENQHPGNHIDQHRRTNPMTFVGFVDRQACQQRDWLRKATRSFSKSLRCGFDGKFRHPPGEVPDDDSGSFLGDHEDSRLPRSIRLVRVTPKPLGLFWRPTSKMRNVVFRRERYRCPIAHGHLNEWRRTVE